MGRISGLQKVIISTAVTVSMGICGWCFATAEDLARQHEKILNIEEDVKEIHNEYLLINKNLVTLIHKNDKRITVLEHVLLNGRTVESLD